MGDASARPVTFGVLTHVDLSQSHSDRVPEIVHAQVGKITTLLAGLATPVLLCRVAHRLERVLAVREDMGRVFAAARLDDRLCQVQEVKDLRPILVSGKCAQRRGDGGAVKEPQR